MSDLDRSDADWAYAQADDERAVREREAREWQAEGSRAYSAAQLVAFARYNSDDYSALEKLHTAIQIIRDDCSKRIRKAMTA